MLIVEITPDMVQRHDAALAEWDRVSEIDCGQDDCYVPENGKADPEDIDLDCPLHSEPFVNLSEVHFESGVDDICVAGIDIDRHENGCPEWKVVAAAFAAVRDELANESEEHPCTG